MAISEANGNQTEEASAFPTQKWCGHEFLYQFRGFWFMQMYLESTQKILENFKPLPTDVILASFPKTGTTWLKSLLHSIIYRNSSKNDDDSLILNHPHDLVPSLETKLYLDFPTDGKSKPRPAFPVDNDPTRPRILGTHIPFQILGDILCSSECKIIYVTRNPKDTLVSLWHFVQKSKNLDQDPWEIETAIDHFCQGILPFGPFYEHVLGYRAESLKRPEKVFFLTFEELKQNPMNLVRKMAEFLGCPFGIEKEDDEKVEEIVKDCSFEVLSNYEVNKSSELLYGFPLPSNSFFRNGEVGDHMNFLDKKMIEKIDAVTMEKFHGSGLVYGI